MKKHIKTFFSSTKVVGVGLASFIGAVALMLLVSCCEEEPIVTLPVISTLGATSVATTSVVSGGNISSDGGAGVVARGVCYGLYPNPTISDNKISSDSGIGYFEVKITGLTAGTTYHARAYAKNSIGVGYGSDETFTTSSAKHIVTISVGKYGASDLLGPIEVDDNGSLKIHLTPSTWYVAESVLIGTTVTPLSNNDYELKNITKDLTLNFTFKLDPVWFQALIGRTWVTTREKQRLASSTEWTIVPPDKLVVEKDTYRSDFKVDVIHGTMDLGRHTYSWQGDSIIRSANPNTGQGGIRQRIISFTKDSLVLRRLIKWYDSYPDKPNPKLDLEVEETFKPE